MRLRLEPWSPAYDTSSIDMGGHEAGASFDDLNLQAELERWQPVQTARSELEFRRLLFVDGTRRMEAKAVDEWNEGSITHRAPCLLGAYAVGIAEVDAQRTQGACRVLRAPVFRTLIVGAARTGEVLRIPGQGSRMGDLNYLPETIPDEDDRENALEQRLQSLMRAAERRLAHETARPEDLLVVDGPLEFEPLKGAVGYVKTLHNLMVPPHEQRILFSLQRGQRTPVFLIGGRLDRYSWFLRLDHGVGWHQGLSGVVRLEVHAHNGIEWARAVADWSCQELPRFAAKGFRDPRAPQQLMPVAFLESELARRMGDRNIVRRRIQLYLRDRYALEEQDQLEFVTPEGEPREAVSELN
jgi:hypothetical protein